jgi:tetratricopeptide (TPR) repeat protein
MQILEHVVATRRDPRAAYYLGNLLYGREQYDAALAQWEAAEAGGETYVVLYRNLAVACYNDRQDNDKALAWMRKALEADPEDPQLVFEMNLLLQLTNSPVAERLRLFDAKPALVARRDDLYIECVRAHNEAGDCEKALALLQAHRFTPCEGREHGVVDQHAFAHLRRGRQALCAGDAEAALAHFRAGQVLPETLGAGIWNKVMNLPCRYFEAACLERLGRSDDARAIYQSTVDAGIDGFSTMYLPALDCYRALALRQLGRRDEAEELLRTRIAEWEAAIDVRDWGHFATTTYFHAFRERPSRARKVHYAYLLGMAHAGLGNADSARKCFRIVLDEDAGHLQAALELEMLGQEE